MLQRIRNAHFVWRNNDDTNFLFFVSRRPSIDADVISGSIAADPLEIIGRNA
jgi:hypothetical protein